MIRSVSGRVFVASCFALAAGACSSSPGNSSGSGGAGSGGATGSGSGGAGTGGAGAGSGGSTGSGGAAATGGSTGSGGAVTDAGSDTSSTDAGSDTSATDSGMPATAAFKLGTVATWHGNATAAYSIIHDDICWDSVGGALAIAEPAQTSRGIHGGYGVITSACDDAKWAQVKKVIADGHDVFNHSTDHPCMTNDKNLAGACDPAAPLSTDFMTEIDNSTTTLKTKLGIPIQFFIFPYDVCDPAAIARLKSLNYLGARCGTDVPTTNTANFPDTFKLNFDVWGPAYSTYITDPRCAGVVQYMSTPAMSPVACRQLILQKLVDDTIAAKGWGIREVHGFVGDPDVWEALPPDEYMAHLDYVKMKMDAGQLWAEGPTPVLRYRWARQYCTMPTLTGSTLKFGTQPANCLTYDTVLSYLVTTTDGSDPTTLKVQQGGKTLPVRRLAKGSYAVDADPTKGDATIVQ
ncbi:MAG TPA: polysaccharide deacetylase family protein [Polyangia bacterium]|nr:polysaccharide deacetylase family protein [Polyangia bacterium]